jgi:site-specific recombinase XerD
MQQQRGLRESSLDYYQRVLIDLLQALGDAPLSYTAAQVRDFVIQRAMSHGISQAKSIASAVRAFLRFLAATGRCPVGLDHAVPSYASWKLSTVPRFLEPADVQRVLDACVAEDARGLRDRAVLLLLARLGLRAGEVAGLTFRDLDWDNARIALCGKARRQEWLPLPQDVGDAILRYLQQGRPALKSDRVFVRVRAPLGPLTRGSVTDIVRSALRRAGVKAPINGAHVFRHSAATAMLRQGASLAAIGAVLRHRSPSTTARYAKIDFGLLAEVAQPWPEVPPC